jgi:hypothetical protein
VQLRAVSDFKELVRACWNHRELRRPTAAQVGRGSGGLILCSISLLITVTGMRAAGKMRYASASDVVCLSYHVACEAGQGITRVWRERGNGCDWPMKQLPTCAVAMRQ